MAFVVQTAAFLALTGGSLYFCVCELQRASRSGGGGGGGARAHPAWAKNRFKLSELVYYRLDYWLSVSAWTKPAALLAASYLLIFVGGAAYRQPQCWRALPLVRALECLDVRGRPARTRTWSPRAAGSSPSC